jgi:hypothetical protein
MERKELKKIMVGVGCGLMIVAGVYLAFQDRGAGDPCFPFESEMRGEFVQNVQARAERVQELHGLRAEAQRRAELNRGQAELLRRDWRWEDEEQVSHLEDAVASSTGLADDYQDEADQAANAIACMEEGGE